MNLSVNILPYLSDVVSESRPKEGFMLERNLKLIATCICALSLSACSSLLVDLGVDLGLEDPGSARGVASDPMRGLALSPVAIAIRNNDIVVGMNRSEVVESWGEPTVREIAGSGRNGHERWMYGSRYSLEGERYLIFESVQVVGWYR